MIWLAITAAVLGLCVLLCSSALIEVFRQLSDIRSALQLEDTPRPLQLRRGELRAAEIGLPAHIETEPEAIAIFLSPTCATCLMIADVFRGGSPSTVWFVISEAGDRIIEALATSRERVVVDHGSRIAARAELNVTPSVLTIRYGEVVRAQSVSTPRQVLTLVPTVMRRGTKLDESAVAPEGRAEEALA